LKNIIYKKIKKKTKEKRLMWGNIIAIHNVLKEKTTKLNS